MRTASWPLASIVSRISRWTTGMRMCGAATASAIATPANAASSRAALRLLLPAVRKIDTRMIGPTSPTDPAAITIVPNGVPIIPSSRRIGTSTPSAVVARAIATITGSSMTPVASSTTAAAAPIASDSSQPPPASRRGRPRMTFSSISDPARKNSAASPMLASASVNGSVCTRSSTSGPTRMPSMISTTTIATRNRRGTSAMIGASTASTAMMKSDCRSGSTRAGCHAAAGGCTHRPMLRFPVTGRSG